MNRRTRKKPPPTDGQVRASQMLTTNGPGALIDLVDDAVLVAGLDYWHYARGKSPRVLDEPRLTSWLRAGDSRFAGVELREPPGDHEHPPEEGGYVEVLRFPRWFLVQGADDHDRAYGRGRRLVHAKELDGRTVRVDGKDRQVVPVRFVRACPKGHIDDISWRYFVHSGDAACRGELWMFERGTSGDLTNITVVCRGCGASKPLSVAMEPQGMPLGPCAGRRPWLGGREANQECTTPEGKPTRAKLLVRTASNSYFPQLVSVISIPEKTDALVETVQHFWSEEFQYVLEPVDLNSSLRRPHIREAVGGASVDEIFAAVQTVRGARRGEGTGEGDDEDVEQTLKQEELEVLLAAPLETGSQPNLTERFFARTLPRPEDPDAIWGFIDRVVLVHRLREVSALIGFTRLEPVSTDVTGDLDLGVEIADITRDESWLPAIENNGEGVFVSLSMDAVRAWEARAEVQAREEVLRRGFEAFLRERPSMQGVEFPGVRYYMLHSLSHMLMTAVALECGYSLSSIKERIYLSEDACAIMLYTGTPDSEGTLGGLVEVGRHIVHHLHTVIRQGRLCSNDPVCSNHEPTNTLEGRPRHGAACHGCLLVSETSCEQRNQYLDRALVVPTVGERGAAFLGVYTDGEGE